MFISAYLRVARISGNCSTIRKCKRKKQGKVVTNSSGMIEKTAIAIPELD